MAIGEYLGNIRPIRRDAVGFYKQGSDLFTDAMTKFGDRVRANAENTALQQLMGNAIEDNEKGIDYRTRLFGMANANPNIDAKSAIDAIGLMASPYTKQQNNVRDFDRGATEFDQTLGLGYDKLNETVRGHDLTYNASMGNGVNGINSKNIVLKAVTNTDSNGVSTTKYVPFDKTTGQVVNGGGSGQPTAEMLTNYLKTEYNLTPEQYSQLPDDKKAIIEDNVNQAFTPAQPATTSGVGVKYPTINQKDKGYADDMPGINNNLKELDQIVNDVTYADSFGAIDKWTGMVGKMFGSSDGVKQAEAAALTSNLLAGFGKAQMAGVLTQQDMDIIKQQIPDISDQPEIAKEKMKFVIRMMKDKNQAYINRMNSSNPDFLKGKGKTYSSPYTDEKQPTLNGRPVQFID